MNIDLHSHSYYSDGVLSPRDLLQLAQNQGCEVFALTDHDTTAGLVEAQNAANLLDLKFICGVEISAMWQNMTVHIVGLNIDMNNKTLQNGLQQHQDFRHTRAVKMASGLAAAGVKNPLQKTKKLAKTDMITRTHFAQMLISEGICKDMKSVFARFLSGNKPGAVSSKWAEFDTVIDWIHTSGGVAVLAHPLRYRLNNNKVKRLMQSLKNADCDGVEVVTGHSNTEEIALIHKWANELDLRSSIGSDYHGWHNQHIQINHFPPLPDKARFILAS